MDIRYILLVCLTTQVCTSQRIDINVEDYLQLVLAYYRPRNIHILTHFTCFENRDNAKLFHSLSDVDIQSRFIGRSGKIPKLIDTPQTTIQGFVVDKNCWDIGQIFSLENHGIIFKNNNFWLIIDNDASIKSNETIAQYEFDFDEFDIYPVSDVFIARRTQNGEIPWVLFDVYKLNHRYKIEVNENGRIETVLNGKLRLSDVNFLSSRRQNLKGVDVDCGLVIAYPERFTYMEDPANNHVDIFTKATYKLSQDIREHLNISCHMRQTDNYGWLRNGTFDGAMGMFEKKQIQMMSHGINMRVERLLQAEFGGDLYTPSTPLIFRQPPLSAVANIFILPLDTTVWYCIFLLLPVIFIVMVILMRHPILKRIPISMFDVATFVWGAVCQQGTHLEIPTTSGRFLLLVTFFATLALFTSYSASIVALLQSPSNFITSIDDLVASPLKVGIHQAGYTRFILSQNYSGVKEVVEKKIAPQGEKGWIYDPFVGVERVRTELFAFQVDSPSAYKAISKTYTESEKCSLSELHMIILPRTTILLERNSGFKEQFKQRVKWYRETGLMQREQNRWLPKKPICVGGRGFMTVGLSEIKPATILLLIGYGVSILILLIEMSFQVILTRRNQQKLKMKKIQFKNHKH